MAQQQARPDSIVEWIELNRLEPPETDVRSHRDRDELRSLAQSLERSGQLQAAKVYPVVDGEAVLEEDATKDEIREALEDAESFRVVDGWSRREAARINNWDRLRCEIFPQAPEHQVVASLDANTERLDMGDYETMKAVQEWAEQNDLSQAEVGDRLGKSRSTISNWFRTLDGFDMAVTAWADPETAVEYGHVREIERLPTDQLKEKVLRDAIEYDRSVAMTRRTAKNTLKGWKRRQADDRSKEEKEADGKDRRATAREQQPPGSDDDVRPCLLCGDPAEGTIAIPACKEDYGMLTRKREAGEPLLQAVQGQPDEEAADGD